MPYAKTDDRVKIYHEEHANQVQVNQLQSWHQTHNAAGDGPRRQRDEYLRLGRPIESPGGRIGPMWPFPAIQA